MRNQTVDRPKVHQDEITIEHILPNIFFKYKFNHSS